MSHPRLSPIKEEFFLLLQTQEDRGFYKAQCCNNSEASRPGLLSVLLSYPVSSLISQNPGLIIYSGKTFNK